MEIHFRNVYVEISAPNTSHSHITLESLFVSLSAYPPHNEGHCPTQDMGRMESPPTPILAVGLRA